MAYLHDKATKIVDSVLDTVGTHVCPRGDAGVPEAVDEHLHRPAGVVARCQQAGQVSWENNMNKPL